jgi:predicted nucleic acid-binding protein
MQTGSVIDLDTVLSIFAAQMGKKYTLPMADSIIYATTLRYSCTLWTTDKHFQDIPYVRYFPKKHGERA